MPPPSDFLDTPLPRLLANMCCILPLEMSGGGPHFRNFWVRPCPLRHVATAGVGQNLLVTPLILALLLEILGFTILPRGVASRWSWAKGDLTSPQTSFGLYYQALWDYGLISGATGGLAGGGGWDGVTLNRKNPLPTNEMVLSFFLGVATF